MNGLQSVLALAGRLLVAFMFLPAGLGKISGFEGTVAYIASAGLPAPQLAAAVAILVEVGGSVALILGWRTRLAALVLALFTLAASASFHHFWSMPADQVMLQQLLFSKNMAIVGGLLVLAAFGAGALSVDRRRAN